MAKVGNVAGRDNMRSKNKRTSIGKSKNSRPNHKDARRRIKGRP